MKKIITLIALCITIVINGCSNKTSSSPVTKTEFAFDTVISITIYDDSKSYVLDKCFLLCDKYENLLSTTVEGSDIWNINHNNGKATNVSYETAALIQKALYYCNETDGVLDLTMFPVSDEWHISDQMTLMSEKKDYEYYIPSSDTLDELLPHVNYKNVLIHDNLGNKIEYTDNMSKDLNYSVTLTDNKSSIDLGFIAKGFIADILKEYLVSEGIESGIINLGGNILLIGSKPDGSSFNVGVQKPFNGVNEVITTIKKSDTSVVSSGCYERYFEHDNQIYHHIFDTHTGYPVQNDLLGVTIISESSTQGDALSTYCYILGLEKGLEYIHSLDNVEAIFVTTDYEIIYS